jgi:hypothetical protein
VLCIYSGADGGLVGVAWGVLCVDCKETAPNLGDCGFLGVPTLAHRMTGVSRWRLPGHVERPVTFGALYDGLAGMGVVAQQMADYRGFLVVHDSHELQLYNDHMDASQVHPQMPGWNWSGVKRPAVPWPRTGENGHYVLSCPFCSEHVASSWSLWQEREKMEITREALDAFSRILRAEPDNFCRLPAALEPEKGLARVAAFLKRHKFHRLFSAIEPRSWEDRRKGIDDA